MSLCVSSPLKRAVLTIVFLHQTKSFQFTLTNCSHAALTFKQTDNVGIQLNSIQFCGINATTNVQFLGTIFEQLIVVICVHYQLLASIFPYPLICCYVNSSRVLHLFH